MAKHDSSRFLLETAASAHSESYFEHEQAFDRLIANLQASEADAGERRTRFHRAQAVVSMRGDRKSHFSVLE